jgi:hypothetical protein
MVSEGTDTPPPTLDSDRLQRAFSTAESIVAERFDVQRESAERLNQGFVDARLASVRESYRLRIDRKKALLENARNKNQPASYIRMLEGGIRNLEAEQANREAAIEQLRSVTAEYALTAAGVLRAGVPHEVR